MRKIKYLIVLMTIFLVPVYGTKEYFDKSIKVAKIAILLMENKYDTEIKNRTFNVIYYDHRGKVEDCHPEDRDLEMERKIGNRLEEMRIGKFKEFIYINGMEGTGLKIPICEVYYIHRNTVETIFVFYESVGIGKYDVMNIQIHDRKFGEKEFQFEAVRMPLNVEFTQDQIKEFIEKRKKK